MTFDDFPLDIENQNPLPVPFTVDFQNKTTAIFETHSGEFAFLSHLPDLHFKKVVVSFTNYHTSYIKSNLYNNFRDANKTYHKCLDILCNIEENQFKLIWEGRTNDFRNS